MEGGGPDRPGLAQGRGQERGAPGAVQGGREVSPPGWRAASGHCRPGAKLRVHSSYCRPWHPSTLKTAFCWKRKLPSTPPLPTPQRGDAPRMCPMESDVLRTGVQTAGPSQLHLERDCRDTSGSCRDPRTWFTLEAETGIGAVGSLAGRPHRAEGCRRAGGHEPRG